MIIKNKQPLTSSSGNIKSLPKNLKRKNSGKGGSLHEAAEKETSAGGVVFRRTWSGIVVALMKDSYGKWTLPKGHVEKGESLEEAAARETLEELGLEEIRFLEPLGKISIWFRDRFEKKGKLINKDIHYFLFETPSHAHLAPDSTQNAYDAKWVSINKLLQSSDYPDLIPIFKNAVAYLKAKN